MDKFDKTFLEDFFFHLNKEQIEYCVLRNYSLLPKSTGSSDLDIWVGQNDIAFFSPIIKSCLKKHKGVIISYIWKRFEPKICLLGENWSVQMDVYKEFVPIKNYKFMHGDIIRQFTSKYNGINVLREEWSNLETFLKEVLNNGSCDRKSSIFPNAQKGLDLISIDELRNAFPFFTSSFIKLLQKIKNKKYSSKLMLAIQKKGLSELKNKNKRYYFDIFRKYYRLYKKPGYIIAVLGTDGSGKSTIINAIIPVLKGAFHNGIHYQHLRPKLLPDIGVLLRKRKTGGKTATVSNPHSGNPSGFWGSFIRWSYYLIDYSFGYLLKILPIISIKSHLFIFDRFYYDYYIDQTRFRTKLPIWLIKFGEIFIPKPDIIICLGGDPNVIFNRKPETSLQEVKRQLENLRKFSLKRKNAVWINTSENLNVTVEATIHSIIEKLKIRFNNLKSL